MNVVVDNIITNYSAVGEGPVVLLLHGWGDNSQTFSVLQNTLGPHFKVIALDLPGFGHTGAPPSTWNLDSYAHFVKKFLEKLGDHEVYAIIGHSNGGAIAIKGLGTTVLNAKKLILLASSGIRNRHSKRRLIFKAIAKTGKVLTFWMSDFQKKRFRKKLYGIAGSDLLVAPHMEETFKVTVRQDIQEDAKKIIQPSLLIYAEKDASVPLADGQKLAGLISNSKLVEIPGADHFLHQTAEDQVNKLIVEFLE